MSASLIALILLAVRVVAALASAGVTLLLARILSPADLGMVLALVSLALIFSIPLSGNIEAGAVHHLVAALARGARAEAAGFLHFSRRFILAMSLPSMLALLAFLYLRGTVTPLPLMLAAAAMMPALALARATARQAGALGAVTRGSTPLLLVRPLTVLAGIGGFWAFGRVPDVVAVIALMLAGAWVTVLIQRLMLRDVFAPIIAPAPDFAARRQWLGTGAHLAPSLMFLDLLRDLIMVLAALVLGDADLGALGICLAILSIPNFALIAVEMSFAPRISAAFARSDSVGVRHLLAQSARLRLALAGTAVLLVWVFASEALALIGADYASAGPVLRWLCLIPLTRLILGNPMLILNISGDSRVIFRVTLLGLLAMAGLVPLAGYWFGIAGVAVMSGVVFCLILGGLYGLCRIRSGCDTSVLVAGFGNSPKRARAAS